MEDFVGFLRFLTVCANDGAMHVISRYISFETNSHVTSQFGKVAQVDERTTLKLKPINECIDGTDVQVVVG